MLTKTLNMKEKEKENDLKINKEIIGENVRITNDETLNGVLTLKEALREADKRNLDLIEISNSGMPICIIADYEKYLYDKKKKAKDASKLQTQTKQKELQFTPNISDHDYSFKKNNAIEFLKAGNSVKFVVKFKGRGIVYKDQGFDVLRRLVEDLEDFGRCADMPKEEGTKIVLTINAKKKK